MIIIMQNAILCHHHKEDSLRIFDTFTTIYTDDVLWLPTTVSRDVIDMEYHQKKGFTDNRRTEISRGGGRYFVRSHRDKQNKVQTKVNCVLFY